MVMMLSTFQLSINAPQIVRRSFGKIKYRFLTRTGQFTFDEAFHFSKWRVQLSFCHSKKKQMRSQAATIMKHE